MILRLFLLLSLIAHVSPSASDKEHKPGGRAMGNVISLVVVLGVIALAVIVVVAILALTGRFENNLIDPAT